MQGYCNKPRYDSASAAQAACQKLLVKSCMVQGEETVCPLQSASACKKGQGKCTGDKLHEKLTKGLKVLYTNIDGFPNKADELLLRVEDDKPDIIVLTECIPKAQCKPLSLACFSVGDEFTAYVNFDPELENMGLLGKRGVEILVRRELNPSEVKFTSHFGEALWIKIKLEGNDELLLGVIYRSPSADGHQSTEALCDLFEMVYACRPSHLVIVGDFNFKEIDWRLGKSASPEQHYTHKFVQTTQNCFLTQHVLSPTHFMPNKEPSLLDLVLSSEEDMILDLSHCPPLGNSHHECLTFRVRCYVDVCKGHSPVLDLKNADFAAFILAIEQSGIANSVQHLDVHEGWECLKSMLKELEGKYIPLKARNKRKQVYSNARLLRAKRKKDYLYGHFRRTGDAAAQANFKRAKNDLRKLTRHLRKEHEKKLAQNVKLKPKSFWKYVRSKQKTRVRVEELKRDDGTRAHTSKEKAETLNQFFSGVFTDEDPDVPQADFGFEGEPLTDVTISEEDVRKRLETLDTNKSPGPDRVHPRIMKELSGPLSVPLTTIFRKSLDTGELPVDWRTGNVTPIFKSGDRSDPGNYRPVSLTAISCKVLESFVRDALLDHFVSNNLLSERQFGFLPGRSCALQLLVVVEEWLRIVDSRGAVDVIYLDFRKAFDSVPHRRLISKLQAYGVDGPLLRWIQAFLSNRKQRVGIESEYSEWTPVTSGIPQGSVLGPVLFLIYINDLPDAVRSTAMLFADDTKVYRRVNSDQDRDVLQADIDAMETWATIWQLPFNRKKCKLMHLGSTNQAFRYQMAGAELATVKKEKDLGVYVDTTLKFHEQAAAAVGRANKILGLIKRTFVALDTFTLPLLFKAMVRPHLEYSNSVWGPTSRADQDAVERVQRRATKLVQSIRHLSYQDRLKRLKLPSMHYRRLRGDVITVYQILSGHLKLNVDDLLERDPHTRTRSHGQKLRQPRVNSRLRQTSFCTRVIPCWNGLPTEVVTAPNVNVFKSRLDKCWEDRWYELRPRQ